MNTTTHMRQTAAAAALAGAVMSMAAVLPAFADTNANSAQPQNAAWAQRMGGHMGGMRGMPGRAPGVFGTVNAISGSTITVTSKGFGPNAQQGIETTYTIDASNATVEKDGATSSRANIAVGDTVMVRGTVNGTNVTAIDIHDGVPQGRGPNGERGEGQGNRPKDRPMMAAIQGNGQPVVGGAVAAVNGTTLTITNKSNVTYTVDASSANVFKGGATSTVANIATGDQVVVQGTVNGTSVTASSIVDHAARLAQAMNGNDTTNAMPSAMPGSIFGRIGGFFRGLF
jgi:hypothetical protein